MTEREYVTILEAARRCGVSDKTIQRAIRRGTLPAQYPQPNRCEIAVSDLERFRPTPGHLSGQASTSLESRVAALEQQVQDLEDLRQHLLDRQASSKPRRVTNAKERTIGPLPTHLVSLLAFAKLHNIAEQKVLTAIDIELLPVKRGQWTDRDGSTVTLAFDAKGRAAFYQVYRDLPLFVACQQCPHGYLDMSRQNMDD